MSDIAELEQRAEDLKAMIEKRDLILKLEKNREFRKIILEDFFVDDCARYAQLSADPAIPESSRQDSLSLAQAAGHLKRYLSVTKRMGDQAEHELKQTNDAIDEIRAEEAQE